MKDHYQLQNVINLQNFKTQDPQKHREKSEE